MDFDPTNHKNVTAVYPSGCWVWTGGINGTGYPVTRYKGKVWTVHRLVMHIAGHEIEGMAVCHRCDTPTCVNPDHLFVGSWGDNNRDRERKGRGRQPSGARHGMALISDDTARSIFLDEVSGIEAARKYGVSVYTVCNIRRRRQWRCVTDGLTAPQYKIAPKTKKNLRQSANA